ncbi:MAG: tRNA dihydrouridine synthase DusB [Planctomycetota bacterium]|nr:tRNA dihydrouridine synthase DusB [Planctomycetota bacterium]
MQRPHTTPRNQDTPVAAPDEFQPLKLGKLEVWPPVVLAPMAGVTNPPFRSICRENGAPLCVSEMITARAWLRANRLTHLLAQPEPGESPRSVQIYSADPDEVREFVKRLVAGDAPEIDGIETCKQPVDHVDLNFGCPVPKVTRAGGGSAIPVKARLLARIVRAAVEAAGDVPVTIKVRKGISDELLTWQDSGRVAQEEGAAAITLHGRTAGELYSGKADWEVIGELVQLVDIPVLGNGDVWEAFDALRLMRQTGCAGVVVGRACLGRPWLFRELADVFDGKEPGPPPTVTEIRALMDRHARALMGFFGPDMGMRQMRKWGAWYTKGLSGSAATRSALVRVESLEEMHAALALLDQDERLPLRALEANRAKGGRRQKVVLPEGYLEDRDDDTPPKGPISDAEMAAWEKALGGG